MINNNKKMKKAAALITLALLISSISCQMASVNGTSTQARNQTGRPEENSTPNQQVENVTSEYYVGAIRGFWFGYN